MGLRILDSISFYKPGDSATIIACCAPMYGWIKCLAFVEAKVAGDNTCKGEGDLLTLKYMNSSNKNYIYSAPRHNRLMFFIDSKTPIEKIIKLFHENMKQWGGRYNPIIPVYDNNIDSYKDLIKHYDPDYIYYNLGVDISLLKKLNYFNPKEYEELNERTNDYPFKDGIDYHFILNDKINGELLRNQQLSILDFKASYNKEIPAELFYQTNFSLFRLYAGEKFFLDKYKLIEIKDDDIIHINELIHRNKIFFKSILSQLYLNTTICKPKDFFATSNFEFIIYDESNPVEDLFYFWNRQLYIDSSTTMNQIIASKGELVLLIEDKFFEGVLYDLAFNSRIDLVSKSISKDNLELIKQNIQSKFKNITFSVAQERNFPFEINRLDYENNFSSINKIKSAIIGKKDILKLPVPLFNKNIDTRGNYVIDIEIEKDETNHLKNIKLPFKAPLYHLICEHECRINSLHNNSLLVSDKTSFVDIKIPDNYEIFQGLLSFRDDEENYIPTGLENLQLSNDGKRLSAFLKLFENDLDEVKSFIEDKFWLDLFRCQSEIKKGGDNSHKKNENKEDNETDGLIENTEQKKNIINDEFWSKLLGHSSEKVKQNEKYESNIPKQKGIFSYKDLKRELALLYKKRIEDIKSKSRIAELNEEQLADYIKKMFKDDFESHIDNGLQYLINNDALFMGMKVKCNSCGSNSWYSLNELKNKMTCKGCYGEIIPGFQSELYYRLNEIIISNLLDGNKIKNSYHGNYITLRTLLCLKNKSVLSFLYSPPMDCSYFDGKKWISTDIDILAVQDGKLIIGEAKCSATDFKEEEKSALIWLANNLKPDKIILAFNSGSFEEVQKKAFDIQAKIVEHSCEVIPYKAELPKYMFGPLLRL